MTFVLFNKYSANASETTQKQSQNINNHYTSTTIKDNNIKAEKAQNNNINTNTQSTVTEPQNKSLKVDNAQNDNHFKLLLISSIKLFEAPFI